jgi:hypothetical protein
VPGLADDPNEDHFKVMGLWCFPETNTKTELATSMRRTLISQASGTRNQYTCSRLEKHQMWTGKLICNLLPEPKLQSREAGSPHRNLRQGYFDADYGLCLHMLVRARFLKLPPFHNPYLCWAKATTNQLQSSQLITGNFRCFTLFGRVRGTAKCSFCRLKVQAGHNDPDKGNETTSLPVHS